MPTLQYNPEKSRTAVASQSTGWLLGGIGMAVPLILFALVWSYYAVNVPKWDDHALRAFLYNFDQETTLSGKIYQLFRQHNEHRIVYDRFVALLDYQLFGKLNFRHLMAIGNLSLVGLLLVFATVCRREGRSVTLVIPIALFLFNLSHWENMFWGMAALQNFSVVLWVILTFFLLIYANRLGLAIASATLATLTSGNGLLVWPIGLVLLALLPNEGLPFRPGNSTRSKAFLPLVSWLLSAVVVLGLYFADYEKPAGNPPLRGTVGDLLKGWLAFTGAAAEALPLKSSLRASILLGGAMTLVTIGLVGWQIVRNRQAISRTIQQRLRAHSGTSTQSIPPLTLFFWGCALFLLGTAAVVAWTRTGFGLDLIITSRYKIYSLTLLSVLYLLVALVVGKRIRPVVVAGGLAGSFVFAWCAYLTFLDDSIWFRNWQLTNQFNWTYTTSRPVAALDSITRHYSNSAPAFYDSSLGAIYGAPQRSVIPLTLTKAPFGYIAQTNAETDLNGLMGKGLTRNAGTYILLRSSRRSYLVPVWQNQQSLRQAHFLPQRLFSNGFKADIWLNSLVAGTYQLFILQVTDNKPATVYPTNQLVTSVGQATDIKKNW
ncbi:hypothetical protein M0L20_00700 [Spirosoma sp. RP8]|uniref:YfhO family protein n=1 Tax=Spirosoma liriopis TaxID=2937440 RepID=A0ABT0HEC1_9BACT|nr:hypothetical protein [Spirosoma liriopis]MCK8490345.1 hypothetical protein [Spirosoma liriopis]